MRLRSRMNLRGAPLRLRLREKRVRLREPAPGLRLRVPHTLGTDNYLPAHKSPSGVRHFCSDSRQTWKLQKSNQSKITICNLENFQKIFLKFDFEFWIWSLCITCIKNYITFTQNIDSLLPGGLWTVTRSVATDFWAWRPGPSLGPPNLTPKLQLPGFGPLFSQKGPYSIYIFGFPLKSGKIGNS